MENTIQAQVKDTPPEEVDELILDNWRGVELAPDDKTLIEVYPNVQFLTLIGVGLKRLENFPSLLHLIKLDLSDNKLSKGLENLSHLAELMSLVLANNQFKDFEDISPLSKLGDLKTLDLFKCPVANREDYKSSVFKMFPQLRILDGYNAQGEEDSLNSDEEYDDEPDINSEGIHSEDDNETDEGDKAPTQLPQKRIIRDRVDPSESKEND